MNSDSWRIRYFADEIAAAMAYDHWAKEARKELNFRTWPSVLFFCISGFAVRSTCTIDLQRMARLP
jgi:hypothetical protein